MSGDLIQRLSNMGQQMGGASGETCREAVEAILNLRERLTREHSQSLGSQDWMEHEVQALRKNCQKLMAALRHYADINYHGEPDLARDTLVEIEGKK